MICPYSYADKDGSAWCGMTYGICDEEAMVMSDRDCPCKGCGLRQVGCHGECQKYAEWRNEEHKRTEDYRRKKQVDAEIAEYVRDSNGRKARQKHWR